MNIFKSLGYRIKTFFKISNKPPKLSEREKLLLSQNKKFKDIHKGKRCFILGNGPSLKDLDPKLLENEFVFTVNQISRLKNYEQLKTNYHFWVDNLFFKINPDNPEDLELLNVIKSVNTPDNKPVCFFPEDRAKTFIEIFKLKDCLDISYFLIGPPFVNDKFPLIDCTNPIPAFNTVVQYAIAMAIYMGFSEIYLHGCDCTSLMVTIKSALKSNDSNDYAYEISSNEKKRMENLLNINSIELYARSYYETLRGFRWLNGYCNTHGIKLINLSTQTVIDSIPRDTIENVLKGE